MHQPDLTNTDGLSYHKIVLKFDLIYICYIEVYRKCKKYFIDI